jgi:hypothetical protein
MSQRTIYDEDTHYRAVRSDSSVSVDGYPLNSLIEWECGPCGARAEHVEGIAHWPWCPQREVETADVHGPGYDGHPHR